MSYPITFTSNRLYQSKNNYGSMVFDPTRIASTPTGNRAYNYGPAYNSALRDNHFSDATPFNTPAINQISMKKNLVGTTYRTLY